MPVGAYAPVTFTGNGVATIIPYNFRILDQAHVKVKLGGVLKALTTDYTVDGVGNSGGGNITMLAAPALGVSGVIYRDVPYVRTEDYQSGGDFNERGVDKDFDLRQMQIQQLDARLLRAVRAPGTDTVDLAELPSAAARANKTLAFDGNGALQVVDPVYGALTDAANVNLVGPLNFVVSRTVKDKLGRDVVSITDWMTASEKDDVYSGTGAINVGAKIRKAYASGAEHIINPHGKYRWDGNTDLGTFTAGARPCLVSNGANFVCDPGMDWNGIPPFANFRFTDCTDGGDIQGPWRFNGNTAVADFAGGTLKGPHAFYFPGNNKGWSIDTIVASNYGQPLQLDRVPSFTASYVATVGNGGSGTNAPGDILTLNPTPGGGRTPAVFTSQATFQVLTVSAGAVQTVAIVNPGNYTTLPGVLTTDDGMSVTSNGAGPNAGVGVMLNIQFADAQESTFNEGFHIGSIVANSCWYGFSSIWGARGITIDNLIADKVYRALIAYGGVERLAFNAVLGDHYGDAFAWGSGFGLGMKGVNGRIRTRPQLTLGGHTASKIRIGTNNSLPAEISGIHLDISAQYSATAAYEGSLILITKEDDKGRGRVMRKWNVNADVRGSPLMDSGAGGNVIGTYLSRAWSAADDIGDGFVFDLAFANSNAVGLDATVKPPLYLSHVPSVGLVKVGGTVWRGTGTPEGQVTAPIGSTYQRRDGGAGTSLYAKESGAGNTGWVAK